MSGQISQQQIATIASNVGRDGWCGDGWCGDGRDGCRDVGEHVLQATHRVGQHLAGDLHQGFRNVVSDIGTSTRDVVSDVRETGAENLEATRDIGAAFLKGVCDFGLALQDDTCGIEQAIVQTEDVIQNDLKDFALSNVEHQRDILSAALLQGGKDQKATLVVARVTEMKVVSEEGKSRDTTREESYKIQLEQKLLLIEGRDTRERARDKIGQADRRAAKATAAILLDACRNEVELRRLLDACCCDLEQLINNLTTELMNVVILTPPSCVPISGTWTPIVFPAAGVPHEIVSVSVGTFTRDCKGFVTIDFSYVIDPIPTLVILPATDIFTLPIPPVPSFPGIIVVGTANPVPSVMGDIGVPDIVVTIVTTALLLATYAIKSPTGALFTVFVSATYSL
jgi:hypothetical protein